MGAARALKPTIYPQALARLYPFLIATAVSDTIPDAFTFTDVSGVALSSTITSNTITVSGINASTAITITGGTYSINGAAYTSSAGNVVNGDMVSVRQTSSGSYNTAVNTALTIGGVSDTFTSITQTAPGTGSVLTLGRRRNRR